MKMIGTILLGCVIVAGLYISYRLVGRRFVHEYKLHEYGAFDFGESWSLLDPPIQVLFVEKADTFFGSFEYVTFTAKNFGKMIAVYDLAKEDYVEFYFYDRVNDSFVRIM